MMRHQSVQAVRIRVLAIVFLLLACLGVSGIVMSAQATTENTDAELDAIEEDIDSVDDEVIAVENDLPEWTNGIECTVCHVDQVYIADTTLEDDESDDVDDNDVDAEDIDNGITDTSETSDLTDANDVQSDDLTDPDAAIDTDEADEAIDSDETDDEDLALEGEPLMALHAGIDCQYCHPDSDDMDYAHWKVTVDSTMPTSLHYTKVYSDVCIVCHEDDYTPEATEDVEALTDHYGLTINPHDIPDAEGTHSSVLCTDCHSMHEVTDTEVRAYDRCISCHHMEVWGCDCHN